MAPFLSLIQLGLLLSIGFTYAQHAAKRPNIVFILTDDQDMRMHSLEHMEKVQRLLINEGTMYSRHYAPTALCCPARVSIMTGLHAHNHLVTDVSGVNGGWKQVLAGGFNDDYLPIWLRDGGYHTYYTGKLYNGMKTDMVQEMTARGWTEADLLVGSHTYQYYDPPFQHIQGDWRHPEKVKIWHNNYTTDMVGDFALGYLKKALKHDKPFFVGIAPITPHSQVGHNPGPPIPATKYRGTRPHAHVPRADNFNPPDRSGVNVVWKLDQLTTHQEDKLDFHYQARTEALLSVDDIVEDVVNLLEKHSQLDNTFIVYSSDNGFHLGHHRLGAGKKYAFEEDINVPLIIRGPGVPKNRKTDIVSAHVDLAPTFLKMAGIDQRPNFDGKPIPHTAEAIQRQEGAGTDEHANVEFWTGASYDVHHELKHHKKRRVNSYKSVRLAGKGYDIMYAVQCHNNSHELYNMNKDPVQMRNLHPSAPAEPGQQNPFDSGEDKIAGYDIKRLLPRIDGLLLLLKSCNRDTCVHPWKHLHRNGEVKNLRDAMQHKYDAKYHRLPKVHFRKCFKNGTVDLWAEGPQWHPDLAEDDGGGGKTGSSSSFQIVMDDDDSEALEVTLSGVETHAVGYDSTDDSDCSASEDRYNEEYEDSEDEVDWEFRELLDDWE